MDDEPGKNHTNMWRGGGVANVEGVRFEYYNNLP